MSDYETQLAQLTKVIAILREGGVKRYRDGDLEVELHAAAPAIGPSVPRDFGELARCPCGHEADAEHNSSGLCLLGCPTSLCRPETVKETVKE